MGGLITQLFPPAPTFTEKELPSQTGKVFIVTGGNSGVGFELVKLLYAANGTIYIAARTPSKITSAIESLKTLYPSSTGTLKPLHLDLTDLSTVAPCVSSFLEQESRLDVLFNNAGISGAPVGTTTAQGHEAIMGTNCLGPYLLTKLLLPILTKTAKSEGTPQGSVRIVFTSSGVIDTAGPPGGVSIAELKPGSYSKDASRNYSASKAGNWFLASEFDKLVRKDGIVCVCQSPGTLKTTGWNNVPWIMRTMMAPLMREPKLGAYTVLWSGLSPEVKVEDGGRLAIPWGRWHPSPNKDILGSLKTKEEGGSGIAGEFWGWCEEETKGFAGSN